MSFATKVSDNHWHGEKVRFPTRGNLASIVLSSPLQHVALPNDPTRFPDWGYRGDAIADHRPAVVHAGTGATLTRGRLRHDALRISRSIDQLTDRRAPVFTGEGKAIWSPESTVVIHIPNCMAYIVSILGITGAKCSASLLSTALQVPELAYVLARLRPQVIITTKGRSQGEGRIRLAIQSLVDRSVEIDTGLVPKEEVQRWARQMAADWDLSERCATVQTGDLPPFRSQRIWLVDLAKGADYYGTGLNASGIPAATLDKRDWINLLRPPPGHPHANSSEPDSLQRLPFAVQEMNKEELQRRVAIILWSSGTTGKSKGVLISHQAIISEAIGLALTRSYVPTSKGKWGGGERWVALAPWFHVYG